MAFTPFDPAAETRIHHDNLPHWRQWGTTYFVTTRLADSIPARIADDWQAKRARWLAEHGVSSPDDLSEADRTLFHREYTARFHALLDAGHGESVLAQPECAACLKRRLLAGHGTAYHLDAWCIMPNHLHALVSPLGKVTLGEILRHWKGGSSFEINRLLGRRGPLWMTEFFDHIVRSEAQLEHYRLYIAENPKKAGLSSGYVVGIGVECNPGL